MELSINGSPLQLDDALVAPQMPLLWALRDVLNLTGITHERTAWPST